MNLNLLSIVGSYSHERLSVFLLVGALPVALHCAEQNNDGCKFGESTREHEWPPGEPDEGVASGFSPSCRPKSRSVPRNPPLFVAAKQRFEIALRPAEMRLD